MNPLKIYVSASHHEPNPRIHGHAPMFSASALEGSAAVSWAWGSDKDTQATAARAILRKIESILLDDPDASNIQIILENDGLRKFMEEFIPRWIVEGTVATKYAGEIWREKYLMQALSNASIRKPNSPHEQAILLQLKEILKQHIRPRAVTAFKKEPSRFANSGTFETDEDEGAPQFSLKSE